MTTSPYTFAEFKDKGNKLLLTTLGVNKAIRDNNPEALKQSLAQLKIISEQLSQYVDQVEPTQIQRPDWMVKNLKELEQASLYDLVQDTDNY